MYDHTGRLIAGQAESAGVRTKIDAHNARALGQSADGSALDRMAAARAAKAAKAMQRSHDSE